MVKIDNRKLAVRQLLDAMDSLNRHKEDDATSFDAVFTCLALLDGDSTYVQGYQLQVRCDLNCRGVALAKRKKYPIDRVSLNSGGALLNSYLGKDRQWAFTGEQVRHDTYFTIEELLTKFFNGCNHISKHSYGDYLKAQCQFLKLLDGYNPCFPWKIELAAISDYDESIACSPTGGTYIPDGFILNEGLSLRDFYKNNY